MNYHSLLLAVVLSVGFAVAQPEGMLLESSNSGIRSTAAPSTTTSNAASEPSSSSNPYTRGVGERVVGFILMGTGVLNFALAVPMGRMMESTSGDGDLWMGLIFAEGGIRTAIGGVLVGAGYAKFNRHKKWEKEHRAAFSLSPAGALLTYEF